MAYNRENEATIVITKKHHSMLKTVAAHERRKIKETTELMIEDCYNSLFPDNTNKTS